ncbi:MAG: SH3-like domain-containing protein [Gaiellales bacterium]
MTARFGPGDAVRVRAMAPPGHLRTPYYIRGKAGVVERVCAEFDNPEELAFGRRDSPKRRLYRVRFDQRDVWDDYAGQDADTIDVELYDHWLEPMGGTA